MTIHRLVARSRENPSIELTLYLPLIGDPSSANGARCDDSVNGPHLARLVAPDGEVWFGEVAVDVDGGQVEAEVLWAGWGDYPTDLSDMFSAPLKRGRPFHARSLHAFEDKWLLHIEQID